MLNRYLHLSKSSRIESFKVYCCFISATPIGSLAAFTSWAVIIAYFDGCMYRGVNSLTVTL